MKYKDRVYGKFEVAESVILDLINSASLQRLKGVDQIGYFEPYAPGTAHSRFEHSVGVYHLLKRYGASLEEQVAGLIHDVSHSAFSHCIDYIIGGKSAKEQSHQDNIFKSFVRSSDIPKILKKYQIDLDYILDEKHFPLKEQPLPNLCADRIDYSLRTAVVFGEIDKNDVGYFLNNLTAVNNRWLFINFPSAKRYAELFSLLNRKYYSSLEAVVMFKTVGDCIKYSLKKGYLNKKDLYRTDKVVIGKIKKRLSSDEKLKVLFKIMNKGNGFSHGPSYDDRVFCKSRAVDPYFIKNNKIKKVSDEDKNWTKVLEKELQPKEYFIKLKWNKG